MLCRIDAAPRGGRTGARALRVPACVRAFCVLLACLVLAACADDGPVDTTPDEAHLFEQRMPALGCYTPVVSPGSCKSASDCPFENTRCVHDASGFNEDGEPAPLTCAPAIGTREAHMPCTRGAECASGLCALTGVCVDPCSADADCGFSDACRPVQTRLGSDALAPVMACTRAIVLPADVRITTSSRGYELGKGRDRVDVPGVEANAMVYVQGECGEDLNLLTLRAKDMDRTVYDRATLRDGTTQENTILHDGSALAALMYPNNPSLTPMASGLQLGVRSERAQHAEVVVASRAPGRGVLDLNVFYAGGGAEQVEGGFHPGEPRVAAMLVAFDNRLREMGLSLGVVNEFDVVGRLREELAVLHVSKKKEGGGRERPVGLDDLFRLSAGLEHPGVNVFLIGDMDDYIGIAGGIPGPLGLHGSERSGVALAADLMGDLVDADQVLLHEVGHFLGLFHTSESSGSVLDPLSDTPECGKDFDTNADGVLGTDECAEHGADNLMFWTGPGTLLSAQQIAVFASAVVLR